MALFGRTARKQSSITMDYAEKRYSSGVLVLVAMMTFALIALGEYALSDLGDGVPPVPYPEYGSSVEAQQAWAYRTEKLEPLEARRNELQWRLEEMKRQYDTSLLESIAGAQSLNGTNTQIREEYRQKTADLEKVKTEIAPLEAEYSRLQAKADVVRSEQMREYARQVRWRQLRVFLWEALFWVPLFAVSLWWYVRNKRVESKWLAVSLAALIGASFLALQSFIIVLWSWLPHELLQRLWAWLAATPLTRIIGYYLLIGIFLFLFGWLITAVHRRITDQVRWGKARIRSLLCPTCSYPLSLSGKHCGSCGLQLKKPCPHCKASGYAWQAKCTECGKAETQE